MTVATSSNPTSAVSPLIIGMAGDRNTGKTTFLAVLNRIMNPKNSEVKHEIFCDPSNDLTRTLLDGHWARMRDEHKFPIATEYKDTPDRYLVDIYRRRTPDSPTATLELHDWPGEVIGIELEKEDHTSEEAVNKHERWKQRREHALQSLAGYDGLIYLFDPESGIYRGLRALPAASIKAFFADLRSKLPPEKRSGRIRIPIAMCLSQMDLPEHWPHWDEPGEYAERLWPGIDNALKDIIDPECYRWFSISAVGTIEDKRFGGIRRSNTYEVKEESKFRRRILRPSELKPEGLEDPIRWLLSRLQTGA